MLIFDNCQVLIDGKSFYLNLFFINKKVTKQLLTLIYEFFSNFSERFLFITGILFIALSFQITRNEFSSNPI
jgi:hypothetical protein